MSYIPGEEYWDLDPDNFKFNSYTWHRKYKLECFQMFNWHCSVCWEYIGLSDGVVHHKTYKHKGGIYQARPEEIEDKICLMCHECHEKEHQNKSIDGVTKMLPKEIPDEEYIECIDCGDSYWFKANYIMEDGRCIICNDVYKKTMSEYIF